MLLGVAECLGVLAYATGAVSGLVLTVPWVDGSLAGATAHSSNAILRGVQHDLGVAAKLRQRTQSTDQGSKIWKVQT